MADKMDVNAGSIDYGNDRKLCRAVQIAVEQERQGPIGGLKALCAMRAASRTSARLRAENHRRSSRPPLERTVERAELRESHQKRNFGNRHAIVHEMALGDVEA